MKEQMARHRCLIVDSDRSAATAIAEHLDPTVLRPLIAGSAEEALDMQDAPPDILISNNRLPGASGLELVESYQARELFPLSILIADRPSFTDSRAAWKLDIAEFLPLPLDLKHVGSVVRTLSDRLHSASTPPNSLRISTPATLAGVQSLVRESMAFAMRHGTGPAARARLGSALFEIADNACRHAYEGTTSGTVLLDLRVSDGEELRVHLSDQGCGFDAVTERLNSTSSLLASDSELPRGLMRVSSLVESLKIHSSPMGTRVDFVVAFGLTTFSQEVNTDFSELDYLDTRTAKRVLRSLQLECPDDLFSIPPSLAVVLGRLLAGSTENQVAHAALWS